MILPQLKISVEDRFIIVQLNAEDTLLPEGQILDNTVEVFGSFSHTHQIILDYREVKYVTSDLIEFINEFSDYNAKLLIDENEYEFVKEEISVPIEILPTKSTHTPYKFEEVDSYIFSDIGEDFNSLYILKDLKPNDELIQKLIDYEKIAGTSVPSIDEWRLIKPFDDERVEYVSYEGYLQKFDELGGLDGAIATHEQLMILRRRYLEHRIDEISKYSLLTEFSFNSRGNDIVIVPYHSYASHNIQTRDGLLVAKPSTIAKRTNSVLLKQLKEFQRILSKIKISESEIQIFFERNPEIIKLLGYQAIYPKVVLQRDDGTFLQPDFILEPYGDRWCDILDLKLPTVKPFVGGRDRRKFSESIQELVAQLREYGAYFENEKYAKRIESIYGIKCYKPKLIGVAGMYASSSDERQERRIMSQYSDVEIITFDKLLRISKDRLLI